MKNYIKTTEKIEVENYPYSFSLRTTLIDSIDFDAKKGYRHSRQTKNPKTGIWNKPKKSTYYALMVRYYDDKGHIQTLCFDLNGDKRINEGTQFLAANFDLFTPEEVKYLYQYIYRMAAIDFKCTCIYGGSKAEDLKPLYTEFLTICGAAIKTGENVFNKLVLNTEAIENTKPENFNPFVQITYERIV